MPAPRRLELTPDQRDELIGIRDRAPKPHAREKAATILKVADGASPRAVGRTGLLRPRRSETIARWVLAYQARGVASFAIRPGRGRTPAFPPLPPAVARAQVYRLVCRSPRLAGRAGSRWRLADLRATIPWLADRDPGRVRHSVRRLGIRARRGRIFVHSPDPTYDAKLAAITAAQLFAHADPDQVVHLSEDEFTDPCRPPVAAGFAPIGSTLPRAPLGYGAATRRRIAGCLNAQTGQFHAWQRAHFDRFTLRRFYRSVAAAYPQAATIYLIQDNRPVHHHADLVDGLADPRIQLLALPTYALWTNPVEQVWRVLKADLLHLHDFADTWSSLQAAVTTWLVQWDRPSPSLLQAVGLCPH